MASRGRAVIDPSDRGAFSFKAIAHPSCQVGIGVFVEVATADAGLVSDNNDRPLQLIGPETSQVKNSGNELELVRPMNIATVHIDDAITVEKKRAIMHEPRRVSVAGGSRQPAVELRNSVIASSFATLPFRASLQYHGTHNAARAMLAATAGVVRSVIGGVPDFGMERRETRPLSSPDTESFTSPRRRPSSIMTWLRVHYGLGTYSRRD
jgi:hypothetical protein